MGQKWENTSRARAAQYVGGGNPASIGHVVDVIAGLLGA